MNPNHIFKRPVTLQINQTYFLRLPGEKKCIPLFTQVKLTSYTACPAVVIVQDERKERFPCHREDLFHTADR